MIRNYIFDFGNVLARFYPDELTAACVENESDREAIRDITFDRLYWDRLDAGTITDEETKAGICSRLPERLHADACRVYDLWVKNLPPVDGMRELVSDLKKSGGKLYLLSNISIKFANEYSENPWLCELFSLFDGLVLSGPIGIVKPSPEIFRYLLDRYALEPSECLFVDDSPKNIAGAESVGICGYLFDGNAEKLRQALKIPR